MHAKRLMSELNVNKLRAKRPRSELKQPRSELSKNKLRVKQPRSELVMNKSELNKNKLRVKRPNCKLSKIELRVQRPTKLFKSLDARSYVRPRASLLMYHRSHSFGSPFHFHSFSGADSSGMMVASSSQVKDNAQLQARGYNSVDNDAFKIVGSVCAHLYPDGEDPSPIAKMMELISFHDLLRVSSQHQLKFIHGSAQSEISAPAFGRFCFQPRHLYFMPNGCSNLLPEMITGNEEARTDALRKLDNFKGDLVEVSTHPPIRVIMQSACLFCPEIHVEPELHIGVRA